MSYTAAHDTPLADHVAPAQRLAGMILQSGWKIVRRIDRSSIQTGGLFSIGYIAESEDGRRAFVKAIDFSAALRAADPARALQAMTAAFNFERDVLGRCRERRMSRIVTAIEDGSIEVDGSIVGRVQYLIFELAAGDVRQVVDAMRRVDEAWALRTMHQVFAALQQLHLDGITHQDLKPSNVLSFEAGQRIRLCDLGRASCQGLPAPHDLLPAAGDRTYAPPELLYGGYTNSFDARRRGYDLYLAGSLLRFLLTGVGATAALMGRLESELHWMRADVSFQDVLPRLVQVYALSLDEFASSVQTPGLGRELREALEQLTHPDPDRRGHPRSRGGVGNRFSVERYISRFDVFARMAEYRIGR